MINKLKKMSRSVLVTIFFSMFGLGALVLKYFIFPFCKNEIQSYETLQKAWYIYIKLLTITGILKVNIKDAEKIKNIKNSIIVSTHPSFVDIVILMSIIPHSTCFVAERLAKNPFLKGVVGQLFILEGQETEVWLNEACQKLDKGLNLIIFPMGIRHRKNEYPKIKRGAALIAQKSGKNIIMLNLENSFDFLQIHQPFYDAGEETVMYDLDCLGEINTEECLHLYPDEVTFKTEVTKKISQVLYKKQI